MDTASKFLADLRERFGQPRERPKQAKDENLTNLEAVCSFLNLPDFRRTKQSEQTFSDFSRSLRTLVGKWKASGPNIEKLKQQDPVLWERIELVTVSIKPTASGQVLIEPVGIPRENQGLSNDEGLLFGFFLMLLMNPLWKKLGGPCARCQKYFVKRSQRQKVYCSKRCGPLETSIAINRKRRKSEHQDKLSKVTRWIAQWENSRSKRDWKDWVSSKSGISRHFLTRAVGKGEIREPRQISQ